MKPKNFKKNSREIWRFWELDFDREGRAF